MFIAKDYDVLACLGIGAGNKAVMVSIRDRVSNEVSTIFFDYDFLHVISQRYSSKWAVARTNYVITKSGFLWIPNKNYFISLRLADELVKHYVTLYKV